jgi:hypothetical protein
VGVVGAIATNLGASSTDPKLDLKRWERILMFCTFIVMAAIGISLFIEKPNARLFAATILVFGLILRGLASVRAERKAAARAIFSYAKEKASGHTMLPAYAISDSAADTIVDIAATVGASYLIVGAPQRNMLVNLLRGNIIRNISSILPEEIHLLVYA